VDNLAYIAILPAIEDFLGRAEEAVSGNTQTHVIVVPNGHGAMPLVVDLNFVDRGVTRFVVVKRKAVGVFIGNFPGEPKWTAPRN
jgi:hypothetical protein